MNEYVKALERICAEGRLQYGCNKADTILEALYQSYCEGRGCDSAPISAQFGQLNEVMCLLPLRQQDQVIDLTCMLCSAHQKEAYIDGLIAGFRLYRELSNDTK